MQTRTYFACLSMVLATAPCQGTEAGARDGSTIEKAIPLQQRGPRAVEEEIAWMTKLYHYTPVRATLDELAEAVGQMKADRKKTVHSPPPWEHGILDHGGQYCSYWMLRTPHGERYIYFDTGVFLSTPREVQRQLMYRVYYMQKALPHS